MPRSQSEAAAVLNLYKLTIEKKRLHQELQNLEIRRQQIGDRLIRLNQQVAQMESAIETLRNDENQGATSLLSGIETSVTTVSATSSSDSFSTFTLEY
jgi:hypothetical protein